MKAMILAAGLGTRLRPLTLTKPKALMEIDGQPLLEIVLTRLIACGVEEVIINLHHYPEQIKSFVAARRNFGIKIEFSLEPDLLDTGGAIKQAAWFLSGREPVLIHNVDVLSDVDLTEMIAQHRKSRALATLAVNVRKTQRYLIFDETLALCGWKSLQENRTIIARDVEGAMIDLAFCGIHVLSPSLFSRLEEVGAFSIIDTYLRLAGEGESIQGFKLGDRSWRDVGKLHELRPD